MGLLARFFRGGLTVEYMMTMKIKEIMTWYEIYELQATIDEIITELSTDSKGNKRKLPKASVIRQKAVDRIEERKKENGIEI